MLPIDLAANARAWAFGCCGRDHDEFADALVKARAADRTALVYIETDPLLGAPSSQAWWDVPVAEVAELASTRDARANYKRAKERQRPYL